MYVCLYVRVRVSVGLLYFGSGLSTESTQKHRVMGGCVRLVDLFISQHQNAAPSATS